jgi:hypothetical protein
LVNIVRTKTSVSMKRCTSFCSLRTSSGLAGSTCASVDQRIDRVTPRHRHERTNSGPLSVVFLDEFEVGIDAELERRLLRLL